MGRKSFLTAIVACLYVLCLVPWSYASEARQVWVSRYSGLGSSDERAYSVAVDGAGNIVVTGNGEDDFTTIKYDTNGNELWVTKYDGPAHSYDGARCRAVDAAGNIYVAGVSRVKDDEDRAYATIKYGPDGSELWVAHYDQPTAFSSDEQVNASAVDSAGNVYVTGKSDGDGTGSDYATIKYDTDGNELWVAGYDGPASDEDAAASLAVDAAGNVYVTGGSNGVAGVLGSDMATIKYDTNGNELWVTRYDGPAAESDAAYALQLDGAGNVYVTGLSDGVAGVHGSDMATIK